MAEFIDTLRGGKAMLYEEISALFEQFKERQHSLSNFLDAIKYQTGLQFKYMCLCSIHCMSSLTKKIELISWQVDLVRVDLVAS